MGINDLYSQLEEKKDFDEISLSNFDFYVKGDAEASSMEHYAFFAIDAIENIAINQSCHNKLISYYKERLEKTKNSFLIARYSHLLYILTHEKKQCLLAISSIRK